MNDVLPQLLCRPKLFVVAVVDVAPVVVMDVVMVIVMVVVMVIVMVGVVIIIVVVIAIVIVTVIGIVICMTRFDRTGSDGIQLALTLWDWT